MVALEERGFKSLSISGKVRDLFIDSKKRILLIASDRFSAFDHVFSEQFISSDGMLHKGILLTQIAKKWFELLPSHFQHHCLGKDELEHALGPELNHLAARSMLGKHLKPIKIEAIVRSHLVGSGWKEYEKKGTVCEIKLPANLKKYQKFETPIFAPSTKGEKNKHDINLSHSDMLTMVGKKLFNEIKDISLNLYKFGSNYCLKKGVFLLDTKFEFGLDENDTVIIIDEIFTPDSSRYILEDDFRQGRYTHYDKQYIRNQLEKSNWNQANSMPPKIESQVIDTLLNRYSKIAQQLF